MNTVSGPDRNVDVEITRMVEMYQLSLLRLSFAYLHDKSLAEDAVQETFLKAYRNYDSFRGESSEKTWLSRIAINCCRDIYRTGWFRHIDRAVSLDMLPEQIQEASDDDNTLTIEVMKLPIRLREVILLYYFEDMITNEIAETMHITQQAVSSRLKRARDRLRKTLGDYEGSEWNG